MLYIFSRDEKLIAILKPDFGRATIKAGTNQAFLHTEYPAAFDRAEVEGCPYFDAVHTEKLTGENIFTFSVPANHQDAQYVTEGNLVAFKDLDGNWQLFEIKRVTDMHDDDLIRTAFCEHVFYELIDDFIEDKRPYNTTAAYALQQALEGTRWQAGNVDDLGLNSVNFYYESVLSALQKVANTWGGELQFRIAVVGNTIAARYVDLLSRRGAETGKQFVYSKDIKSIEREVDLTQVVTALYGRGKGEQIEEGHGRRITFEDVEWSVANGDPVDKPLGQKWVGDPEALARWGRPGGRHRFGVFEDSEEEDPAVLLQKTWEELQRRKNPRITYKLDVADLERLTGYEHEKVRLGDTVRVIDRAFSPELLVEARVIEIQRDLLQPESTKITLGNFAPSLADEVLRQEQIRQIVSDRQGIWDRANQFNPDGTLNTSWLEGIIDTLQNEVRAGKGTVTVTDDNGILIVDDPDNPTKALRLLGGMFAIANSKDPVTGEWNWRTFGTGDGFTADEINAGQIQTSLVKIIGNTNFYWDSDNIYIINPSDTNQQIRLGKYDGTNLGIAFTKDGGTNWTQAITFTGINASSITTGTLDASKVNVANLNASNITTGTLDASKVNVANLNASKITTGTLDASKVNVVNLNASNITTGTMSANKIYGGTLTLGGSNNANGVLSIKDASGSIKAKGDVNGFFVLDEGVNISLESKNNLIPDHSFEAIPTSGSADATYYDSAVGTLSGNMFDWLIGTGSPRILSARNTDTTPEAAFGMQCAVVNYSNWFQIYVPVKPSATYYVSGYTARGYRNPSSGTSRLYVAFYDYNLTILSTTAVNFTPNSAQFDWKRVGFSFTTPSNTAYVRIVPYAVDSNYVYWDGIQLVEGAFPARYDPEENLWRHIYGVAGLQEPPSLGWNIAFSWSGSISPNTSVTITHNLGCTPIVMLDGTVGNITLTWQTVDANTIRVYNYNNANNTWKGTVRLY